MKEEFLIDDRSRERIVTDMDTCFMVEAGAGSGKTTMLVNRMVAMVESGIDIRQICAITFTKAAAGEFYRRFQRILLKRSNPAYDYESDSKGRAGELPAPTEQSRKNCAYALENIDLCFMGTIDSFCNRILTEHPTEAGIPSDAAVKSDDEMYSIYHKTFVDIGNGKYGSELRSLQEEFIRLNTNPEEVYLRAMPVIMGNRHVDFEFSKASPPELEKDCKDQKNLLLKLLDVLAAHPELRFRGYMSGEEKKGEVKGWRVVKNMRSLLRDNWDENISGIKMALTMLEGLVFSCGTEWMEQRYGIKNDAADPFLEEVYGQFGNFRFTVISKKYLDTILSKIDGYMYYTGMKFFESSADHIVDEMRKRGELSYFDFLYYLRNMLKKDSENGGALIGHIRGKHRYFLIDEFQDTNPMQAEIFFYLSSEEPVNRWEDCRPKPGSLFIVGDPKQSIYRFRGADVTSYLKVKGLFEKGVGEVLYLTRNFRSTTMLCNYFNSIFTPVMSEETDIQSKFRPIPVDENDPKANTVGGFCTYMALEGAAGRRNFPEYGDEKQVRKIIRMITGNPKYTFTDEEGAERVPEYRDFMLITRSKRNLARYIREFTEWNIPVRVEGKVLSSECPSLYALFDIYSAVTDPRDEPTLYRLLTGPVYGVLDEEVAAYKLRYGLCVTGENKDARWEEGSSYERIGRILRELGEIAKKAGYSTPSAMLLKIMNRIRFFETIPDIHLEILYYVLELVRNSEACGEIPTHALGRICLMTLLENTGDQERCLNLKKKDNSVHIANLHKVKGLEAPFVILGYSYPMEVQPSVRIDYVSEEPKGYLFSIGRYDDDGYHVFFKTPGHVNEMTKERTHLKAEEERLLYVAATRARNLLIICDSVFCRGKNGLTHRSFWSPLWEKLTPPVIQRIPLDKNGYILRDSTKRPPVSEERALAADLYDQAEAEDLFGERGAEIPGYKIRYPSAAVAEETTSGGDAYGGAQDAMTAVPAKKRPQNRVHYIPDQFGTMVHRMMEILVDSRWMVDKKLAIRRAMEESYNTKTKPYQTDIKRTLLEIAGKMERGGFAQKGDVPSDLYAELRGASEIWCEVPFIFKEENDLWKGTIDLLYQKDGKWHIVDYKTNLEDENLKEHYRPQMDAYRHALLVTRGIKADASIYHIEC